jgi:MFS transporter, DHA1 family, inner membrane transport protein
MQVPFAHIASIDLIQPDSIAVQTMQADSIAVQTIQTDSVAVQNARDPAPGEEVFVMPLAIFALTIAAYAIGTTEFVIVGLLPTVATDLHITLPLAGLIVSVYALGVTFGAPILTALTGRIERKL